MKSRLVLLTVLTLVMTLLLTTRPVVADGNPDGTLGEQYGSTTAIDPDDDATCLGGANGTQRGDILDFGAFWSGKWNFYFTVDSNDALNSASAPTYMLMIDVPPANPSPYNFNGGVEWQRDFQARADYFVGCYATGADTLTCELRQADGSRTQLGAPFSATTATRGTRRQIEIQLPNVSGTQGDLLSNSAIDVVAATVYGGDGGTVIDASNSGASSCLEGGADLSSYMVTTAANCNTLGRPNGSGGLQCTSYPYRTTVNAIESGMNSCPSTLTGVDMDGDPDTGPSPAPDYTLLSESGFGAPYQGGSNTTSDYIGESSSYTYYSDAGAGSGGNTSGYGTLGGTAELAQIYAHADRRYLYLVVQGPTALGGGGSMVNPPADQSNLYIPIDVPNITSDASTGGIGADEVADAPASRRVNFKGWSPDYVVEVIWAGNDTTTDNVHLWQNGAGTTWTAVGDFQTVNNSVPNTIAATTTRYFARKTGTYELAIPWSSLGYTGINPHPGVTDYVRVAAFTTGDNNLGGESDDWDIFDSAPGIGQGCGALGCHEQVGDDPGDGDSTEQTGGESDETLDQGQTDTINNVQPASDRTSRDVDTIEEYLVFTPDANYIACPLAVTMDSFTATGIATGVRLDWITASELDTLGFHLYRAESSTATPTRLTTTMIPATGGAMGSLYAYTDSTAAGGTTYFYWLDALSTDGSTERFGPVSATPQVPTAITLSRPVTSSPSALPMLVVMGVAIVGSLALVRRRN